MLIFHDGTLDGLTTSTGIVGALTRDDVFRAKYRSDEAHGLCFIEDVVTVLRGAPTLLQVDLKLMRPITPARSEALMTALQPLGDRVIVGSQAHWNLRALPGVPRAFDPTLQWHFDPKQELDEAWPKQLGVHGFYDDSPLAAIRHVSPGDYLEQRVQDLLGIFSPVVEWMVDINTIRRMHAMGLNLAERLARSNCALAAWTVRERTPDRANVVRELCALGVETFITDAPLTVARELSARVS